MRTTQRKRSLGSVIGTGTVYRGDVEIAVVRYRLKQYLNEIDVEQAASRNGGASNCEQSDQNQGNKGETTHGGALR